MSNPPYEDESFDVGTDNDCSHIGCHCIATAGGFCSSSCKTADLQGELELACNCGHSDCMGDFFSERPLRTAHM